MSPCLCDFRKDTSASLQCLADESACKVLEARGRRDNVQRSWLLVISLAGFLFWPLHLLERILER